MSVIQYTGLGYDSSWAEVAGWLLTGFLVAQVPIWATVALCRTSTQSSTLLTAMLRGSGCTVSLRGLLKPDAQWGPSALNCSVAPATNGPVQDADLTSVVQVSSPSARTKTMTAEHAYRNGYCVSNAHVTQTV